jgi:hypothetical protein
MLPKNGLYDSSMDWMMVNQTLEEELSLERAVRELEDCVDAEALSQICAAMARQNWHQNRLLRQAVERIAELESIVL